MNKDTGHDTDTLHFVTLTYKINVFLKKKHYL